MDILVLQLNMYLLIKYTLVLFSMNIIRGNPSNIYLTLSDEFYLESHHFKQRCHTPKSKSVCKS